MIVFIDEDWYGSIVAEHDSPVFRICNMRCRRKMAFDEDLPLQRRQFMYINKLVEAMA